MDDLLEVKVITCEQIRTGIENNLSLEILQEGNSRKKVKEFLSAKLAKEKANDKKYSIEIDLRIWYKTRTLKQNRLHWSLCSIMSMVECDDKYEMKDAFHRGVMDLYCPRKEKNPITDKMEAVSSSELKTYEMAEVIEGQFCELSLMKVPISKASQIESLWIEWHNWRGSLAEDPLENTYADINDYRNRVRHCEACLVSLGNRDLAKGDLAHIVSAGSGGTDDLWNRIMLCEIHHRAVAHQHGWLRIIKDHPHLEWRILRARERAGAGPLIDPMTEVRKDLVEYGSRKTCQNAR